MTQLRPAAVEEEWPEDRDGGRHAGRRRAAEPAVYQQMVEQVAAQLRGQYVGGPPSSLAVMPVVGFGEQAAGVIVPSLERVSGALSPGAALMVLVNRPQRQPADGTLGLVRAWRAQASHVPVAIAEVALVQRPRLGELRQLGVDAAEQAWGALPGGTAVVMVDDDVVAAPPGTGARLERVLDGVELAVGPVLFDHPTVRTSLFPDLYAGDLFRALLTDGLLERVERDRAALPESVIESLILSGHLAVRRDALAQVGGMRDLNELTQLGRDVLAMAPTGPRSAFGRSVLLSARGAGEDPVTRLQRLAVRVHSRRALAAYGACGAATVTQWRSQRLRSSTIDPVRVRPASLPAPPPLAATPAADRARVAGPVARHLAVVLDHLQPPPDAAARALALLGMADGDVDLRPPADGSGWRLHIRRPAGLVERLAELQSHDLAAVPLPTGPRSAVGAPPW